MNTNQKNPVDMLTNDLGERSRNLWLAGLGALVTLEAESTKLIDTMARQRTELVNDTHNRLDGLQKEVEKVFQDFVKRGAKVETKGRKQLTAQVEALKADMEATTQNIVKQGEAATGRFEHMMEGAVETVLERLDVPTRTEVKDLTEQVDHLADRINRLANLLRQQAAKV